ncbi:hypothetical protein RCC89_15840 [Cytophagaceae bacterium ABcell3]|nr:hypothetical protein RCC89_15840 [Cytophagaceae bacterium ABcell3]
MKLIPYILLFLCSGAVAQTKISLDKDMVINITGWGDAGLLVDEQDAAGDPAAGKGGKVETRWLPGWKDWFYPSSAIIDLKTTYELTEIWLFHGKGYGSFSVHTGSLKDWEFQLNDRMMEFNQWTKHEVNATCRYLKVTIDEKGAVPEEIVLYGKRVGEEFKEPDPVKHERPLMKDFIGINGFPDDPLEVSQVGGFVREYHNWDWNELEKGRLRFSPGYPDLDYDAYYKKMKEAEILVAPCLKQSPSWMTAHREHKPVPAGRDASEPYSYREKASYMFQYAARYGSVEVDEELILLDDGQEKKTGLGYLKYYEDWNEPDMWWNERKGYFTPFEYVAMASANYDGHQGRMGKGFGVKAADPDAVFVMAGLAAMRLDYLKAMKLWSQAYRGEDFPADVINLHHYCNDVGGQGQSSVGVSPEEDGFKKRLERFVDYRDKHLPGKEVWVTEFGYDVNQQSIQRAPAIGGFSGEEVQAIWLIRSYLALAAAGVDKAAMYMVRDDPNPDTTGRFVTSGLMQGNHERKRTSWYYLNTFGYLLGDYVFEREVSSDKSGVCNYRFTNPQTGDFVYVLWSPTSKGLEVKNHSLVLPDNANSYSVVELEHKRPKGKVLVSENDDKHIKVNVSEKPIFVKVRVGDEYNKN